METECSPDSRRHNSLISRRLGIVPVALAAAVFGADLMFEIPPVPLSVDIAGQLVALTISGNISGSPAPSRESAQSFHLNLRADLADLQNHLTPLLQSELDQSNRCGERIAIQNATLVPSPPAGRLTVQLHFEKWACFKALGKENAKRLLGGNGTVQVMLTPRVDEGNTVRLDADIGKIDADGSLGEVLRSGSLGDALRDKIREALLKAIQKSADLQVRASGTGPALRHHSVDLFLEDGGSGRLTLTLDPDPGCAGLPNRFPRPGIMDFRGVEHPVAGSALRLPGIRHQQPPPRAPPSSLSACNARFASRIGKISGLNWVRTGISAATLRNSRPSSRVLLATAAHAALLIDQVIGKGRESGSCRNSTQDEPAAFFESLQRRGYQLARRGEHDGGVERLRRLGVRRSSPQRAKFERQLAMLLFARTHVNIDAPMLRHLDGYMPRRAESIQADARTATDFGQTQTAESR